jgi:hypothetical protein
MSGRPFPPSVCLVEGHPGMHAGQVVSAVAEEFKQLGNRVFPKIMFIERDVLK